MYLCLLFHASDIFGILLFLMLALSLGHDQLQILLCCQALMSPSRGLLQAVKGNIDRHERQGWQARKAGLKGTASRIRDHERQRLAGTEGRIEEDGRQD